MRRQRAAVAEGHKSGSRVGREHDDAVWPCHPDRQVERAWLTRLGNMPPIRVLVVHESTLGGVQEGHAQLDCRRS